MKNANVEKLTYVGMKKDFNNTKRKTTFKSVTKTLSMLKESRLIRNTDENTQYLYYR